MQPALRHAAAGHGSGRRLLRAAPLDGAARGDDGRSAALGAAVLNERVAAGAEASKGLTKRTDGEPEVQRACRMAR